jgi:DNA-binding XRE family transcriptional regulator
MTGTEIKQEREKRFWTQRDLALKAHIQHPLISLWETGKYNPSLKSQKKLKQVFDENPAN